MDFGPTSRLDGVPDASTHRPAMGKDGDRGSGASFYCEHPPPDQDQPLALLTLFPLQNW